MPLNHDKATAKVSVTGLAISSFNEKTRNWEVALITDQDHVIRMRVVKLNADGDSSATTFELDDKHRIFITAANAVIPKEPIFMEGPFDRKNIETSHPEDFRWIVNFEEEFNGGERIPVKKIAATELFVSHPVLYAEKDHKRRDMNLLNIGTEELTEFGTLAEVCNADITCNPGGAVILCVEGPLGFSIDLPHIEGHTHTIRIENECQKGVGAAEEEEPPPTDFSEYFKMMNLPEEKQFDLKRKEGIEGSDAVCNIGFMGTRSSFLPL
jgi:hypothetical protein